MRNLRPFKRWEYDAAQSSQSPEIRSPQVKPGPIDHGREQQALLVVGILAGMYALGFKRSESLCTGEICISICKAILTPLSKRSRSSLL